MANYTKSTDFAVKDGLASGNPAKIVKGTEIDTEFNNIATAVSTKADSGANSSITSLTGLTTPLSVAQGGTGVATITGVIKGSGTSAFSAATAGTDYAKPDTASTWSANQTFGSGYLKLSGATSGTGTLNAPAAAATYTWTLPAATDTLAAVGFAQTFTASQRGTVTTDNDGSFDMNVTNNFKCTPTGNITLTFTNITAGQSGFVLLVNGSNYTISAAATTKVATGALSAMSATGTYLLSYFSDGTNVFVVNSGALA